MRQEASVMEGDPRDLRQETNSSDPEEWIQGEWEAKKLEDEYLLGDVIGRGASSVVYKCLRKGRTEWACKVLKKKLLDKKSFQKEIQNLLKLKHPNIVQLRDVFETPNEIQLIFEMANGGELFERIVQKGCYTEEDAAQAVQHILNALQYLHSKGIIHRGVKPENLLYKSPTEESILKLSDFGITRLFSDGNQLSNKFNGAYGIYAPEIIRNQEYDSSVDLWNLGVVTYIMLCGFEPFWDEENQTVSHKKVTEGNFSFPSPWWDNVSDSAKELVSKLLSTDPKRRPTASEALNHPWILGTSTFSVPMNETVIKLKEFNAKRRFRVATTAVIATQRALSYLPIKIREGKTGRESHCRSSSDSATVKCGHEKNVENLDCYHRSITDDSSNALKNRNCSLKNAMIDGRSIEEKHSATLLTDLTTQYKESYIDLR